VQTTFPRLMLDHAKARPDAPALREKEYGIWQTTTWGAGAAGAPPGLRPGARRPEARRPCGGGGREPPAPVRHDAGRAVAGRVPVPLYQDAAAAEYAFPINNAEVASPWSRTRSRSTRCSSCARTCPSWRASGTTTRAACATTTSPGLDSLDALMAAGAAHDAANAALFDDEVARCQPARRGGDVLHLAAPPATPRAWCTPIYTLLDRAGAGARFDRLTTARRCWPTCRRPGSARTSSAMRSGWPAATWSTAPRARPR
jgi:long-chain acyl-CoA synthetase